MIPGAAFHDGIERRIDLAMVNGHVFVNNATVGLYAKVVQSPEYRDRSASSPRGSTLTQLALVIAGRPALGEAQPGRLIRMG